jgi:hypothetical protein
VDSDPDLFDPADEREREIRRRMDYVRDRLRLDGDLSEILDALIEGAELNTLEEAVLRDHIVGGSTQQEIADKLNRPLGTICRVTSVMLTKVRIFLDGRNSWS